MNQLTIGFDASQEKIELLKRTVCKGSTNDEFDLFVHACKRTGLDPFMRQIYAVKRWDGALRREVMQIQTGIDGYRLIADRTGKYAPGKETVFSYSSDGKLVSSTAYVKKQTPDGTWHEISSTAYFDEYVCTKKDGAPNTMWATKGHIMLSKCAEACALRKAFPAELSGIYTKEEMEQADSGKEKVEEAKQAQIQIPEVCENTDEEFHNLFEEDIARVPLFKDYLAAAAEHYKCDINAVKALAVQNPDRFRTNLMKWSKMQEQKSA